jgi:PPOX class probable F420-dependent enzyme
MRINQQEARTSFESAPVARLATAGKDQRPHLVPVTFAVVGDTVVTAVDHKPKSTTRLRRLRNVDENRQVCLLADHYADDWSQLWWVRADGEAAIVGADERPDLVRALEDKYIQYREQPPREALIVVDVERWIGWSASS